MRGAGDATQTRGSGSVFFHSFFLSLASVDAAIKWFKRNEITVCGLCNPEALLWMAVGRERSYAP